MKDRQLYLVRITYTDMILSDYFEGINKVKNIVNRYSKRMDVEKIEYGKAPCRSKSQYCNWDESTIVIGYDKYGRIE